MYENKHPHGNMAVLVGATEFGLGASAEASAAAEHPVLPRDDVHTTPHPYSMSTPLPGIEEGEPATIATTALGSATSCTAASSPARRPIASARWLG